MIAYVKYDAVYAFMHMHVKCIQGYRFMLIAGFENKVQVCAGVL